MIGVMAAKGNVSNADTGKRQGKNPRVNRKGRTQKVGVIARGGFRVNLAQVHRLGTAPPWRPVPGEQGLKCSQLGTSISLTRKFTAIRPNGGTNIRCNVALGADLYAFQGLAGEVLRRSGNEVKRSPACCMIPLETVIGGCT